MLQLCKHFYEFKGLSVFSNNRSLSVYVWTIHEKQVKKKPKQYSIEHFGTIK